MANHAVWDRRSEQDRADFAALLAPLIVASRTKDFEGEKAKPQLHVWMLSLHDVPKDILRSAVERLLARGVTWMPKPGDVRAECSAVVSERLAALVPEAERIQAACERCHGSGWAELFDVSGVSRGVTRCDCHGRVLALFAGQPKPIALPPAPTDEGAA